jgi:hypothetical protein
MDLVFVALPHLQMQHCAQAGASVLACKRFACGEYTHHAQRHSERSKPTLLLPARSREVAGLRREESLFIPESHSPFFATRVRTQQSRGVALWLPGR